MLAPSRDNNLAEIARLRYGALTQVGPGIQMRLKAGYATPAEHYEALVESLVTPETVWLDVGCGRNLFPQNPRLARLLADRCARLVGIDPDETLQQNEFVHEKAQQPIETFQTERRFDLVTLRMVAEHITDPAALTAALARLTKPGAQVVVYTVNKWAASSLAAGWTPFRLHQPLKRLLWNTCKDDTFPVCYRMNTRRVLLRQFQAAGFDELQFRYLPDVVFWRFRLLHSGELALWKVTERMRLPHPETCLLAVYRKRD